AARRDALRPRPRRRGAATCTRDELGDDGVALARPGRGAPHGAAAQADHRAVGANAAGRGAERGGRSSRQEPRRRAPANAAHGEPRSAPSANRRALLAGEARGRQWLVTYITSLTRITGSHPRH